MHLDEHVRRRAGTAMEAIDVLGDDGDDLARAFERDDGVVHGVRLRVLIDLPGLQLVVPGPRHVPLRTRGTPHTAQADGGSRHRQGRGNPECRWRSTRRRRRRPEWTGTPAAVPPGVARSRFTVAFGTECLSRCCQGGLSRWRLPCALFSYGLSNDAAPFATSLDDAGAGARLGPWTASAFRLRSAHFRATSLPSRRPPSIGGRSGASGRACRRRRSGSCCGTASSCCPGAWRSARDHRREEPPGAVWLARRFRAEFRRGLHVRRGGHPRRPRRSARGGVSRAGRPARGGRGGCGSARTACTPRAKTSTATTTWATPSIGSGSIARWCIRAPISRRQRSRSKRRRWPRWTWCAGSSGCARATASSKPAAGGARSRCSWRSNYGVTVRAFNLSSEQIAYARERAAREGLAGRVEFVEDDYRNITGACDAFVSVGMLEHVGLPDFPDARQA